MSGRLEKMYERRDAQNADKKKRNELLKTQATIEQKNRQQDNREQFLEMIKVKTEECLNKQKEQENEKQNSNTDVSELKTIKTLKKVKKAKKENKGDSKTITGTSFKEILNSPELKRIYNDGQEK